MTALAKKIRVMHVIDTLEIGGAERMAVNLVNALPREIFDLSLSTTRYEGPLAKLVNPDITTISLRRRSRYDMGAIYRLTMFIRRHHIDIVHAHSTSVFMAVIAASLAGSTRVIWHEHGGKRLLAQRPFIPYFFVSKQCAWVVCVNQDISAWMTNHLKYPAKNVSYVPNFVVPDDLTQLNTVSLPGHKGDRIVCLANLTPPKDHETLLKAMTKVVEVAPNAHLLLIGKTTDQDYHQQLVEKSHNLLLDKHVTWMGQREDAYAILQECDIGVLSSRTEGLPLVLLEYGFAGLATVATRVGQCPDVLAQGQAGLLVEPGASDELAQAIVYLLENEERRAEWGKRLHQRVKAHYSVEAVLPQIQEIYRKVMSV